MSGLVSPHGGAELKPLLVPQAERLAELERASSLRKVALSSREISDLLMLGMGAYTPLAGFMGEADWRGCCREMKCADGLFWPIPITLSCDQDTAAGLAIGDDVALADEAGTLFGVLTLSEMYRIDKVFECVHVFRTTDAKHPGVAKVMDQGAINLAGPVRTLDEDHYPQTYKGLYYRPAETRALFADKGWSTVAAFQTRNPMHRSHEYLAKIAVELCDGLLIHQVLGALKPGDIPADVRLNHRIPATSGVLADESAQLLRGFFGERRRQARAAREAQR